MIKTLSLENFKCFKDSQKIYIKPLTVLCGTNSCGKSTVIQSILMLKQNYESYSPYYSVLLNGKFTNLGSFGNIVYNKETANIVRISLELDIDKNIPTFFMEDLGLSTHEKGEIKYLLDLNIELKDSDFPQDNKNLIHKFSIKAKYIQNTTKNVDGSEIYFSMTKGGKFNINYINRGRDRYHREKTRSNNSEKEQLFSNVEVSFVNLIPYIQRNDKNVDSFEFTSMLSSLRFIFESEFSNLHYIGPLREEPSRRYINEVSQFDIGIRGENAPFILTNEGKKKIKPYYFFDAEEGKWKEIRDENLQSSVNRWLRYMEISDQYSVVSQQEIIRLYLEANKQNHTEVSLADVGFGVSQILPILVEGLRISPGQTLILEQPEIHLHPKLQMQLADFFISMILSGKNVLLETHSDHIINRIARRIIEDEENLIISKANILFFEQGNKGSIINSIKIDPTRGVVNWPRGFFDQSAEEKKAILSKGIERRSKNR